MIHHTIIEYVGNCTGTYPLLFGHTERCQMARPLLTRSRCYMVGDPLLPFPYWSYYKLYGVQPICNNMYFKMLYTIFELLAAYNLKFPPIKIFQLVTVIFDVSCELFWSKKHSTRLIYKMFLKYYSSYTRKFVWYLFINFKKWNYIRPRYLRN